MTDTPTVTIRVPKDIMDQLPSVSTVRGEGRTAFILAAIREKLEKDTKK